MIRTQIQLTEKQWKVLKELSIARRISMAELVRQSIDLLVQTPEALSMEEIRKTALAITGKYHSGISDISTNHDKYLDEIYGS